MSPAPPIGASRPAQADNERPRTRAHRVQNQLTGTEGGGPPGVQLVFVQAGNATRLGNFEDGRMLSWRVGVAGRHRLTGKGARNGTGNFTVAGGQGGVYGAVATVRDGAGDDLAPTSPL